MFRFADVPLSLSGMTRIHGSRVFLRAPTMEDWAGMGRAARPQPGFPDAVGADLAGRFAGPRPFPPPAAPAGPRMAGRRGLWLLRVPQRQAPAGRRHQSQQRAPRRRPGGLGRLLDGPALCRAGADDRRRCARCCPSCSTSCGCTGSRPPACRTTSRPRACWPRSASTRRAGAAVSAHQRTVGRPSAVRPVACRLRRHAASEP